MPGGAELGNRLDDELIGELHHAIDTGRTLPARWYTDPNVLQREQLHVLRPSWQPVRSLTGLNDPGDYAAEMVLGVPILLVRGKDGELRGFVNVCRHRAHLVMSGSGSTSSLQCPYHAWTYGLDGRLRGVPRAPETFEKEGLGLVPIQVATWGDMLFVSLDPDSRPFTATFGDLRATAEAIGISLDGLDVRAVEPWDFACNWKVFYDNSAECYHCPTVHPSFTDDYLVGEDEYALRPHDTFVHHVSPHRPTGNGRVPDWEMCSVWPNWSIGGAGRAGVVLLWRFTPVDASHTEIVTYLLAGPSVGDAAVEDEFNWWRAIVYGEDRRACESVQTGLETGLVRDGPLLLGSEHIIHRFQEELLRAFSAPALTR